MAKREELRVDLTANDQASGKIDDVAAKLEGLSGSAQVEITATDEATEVVENVAEEVEGLDGEAAEVGLAAEDEATEVVEEVAEAVETLDGETAEPTLSADDQASGEIEAVSGELATLDGESASPTVELDDQATDDIGDVVTSLGEVEDTFTATIEVDGAEEAETATGGMVTNLGLIAGGTGLAAGVVAGMVAIGTKAADSVLDIQALAAATGDGSGGALEQASRLNGVWDLIGGSTDTLERNIIRANDQLRESPELAARLGIEIGANQAPMDVFIDAVRVLNSGQLTANERLELSLEIFGTRGILMLNDLQTVVGDIDDGMAEIGENEIITEEDVEQAREFKEQWDDVGDKIADIGRTSLPLINTALSGLVGFMDGSVLPAFQDWWDDVIPDWVFGGDPIDAPLFETQVATPEQIAIVEEYEAGLEETQGALEGVAGATDVTADATEDAAEALEEHIEQVKADIDALEEHIDALTEQADGFRETADAALDVSDANRDMTDATNAYAAAVEESGEDSQEAADALRGVRDAAIKVADAQVALAQAQAQARGTTLSEVQALDVMNTSLLNQARTLQGPARQAILQRIADVNAIPSDVMTLIAAAIARGDLAEAQRLLDAASAPRTTLVQAEADAQALQNAESHLKWLARDRSAYIGLRGPGAGGGSRFGSYAIATGSSYTNRGLALVGEDGPELVAMPAGARVTNAGQTDEWMRNGGGGGTNYYYTTNNFPAGVRSRDTVRAERRYARLQAS